jgi:hypothetical protein
MMAIAIDGGTASAMPRDNRDLDFTFLVDIGLQY